MVLNNERYLWICMCVRGSCYDGNNSHFLSSFLSLHPSQLRVCRACSHSAPSGGAARSGDGRRGWFSPVKSSRRFKLYACLYGVWPCVLILESLPMAYARNVLGSSACSSCFPSWWRRREGGGSSGNFSNKIRGVPPPIDFLNGDRVRRP
jgi:hypothetical protein